MNNSLIDYHSEISPVFATLLLNSRCTSILYCNPLTGNNLFAHASSNLGVTISSLEHDYYNKRYIGGRRLEEE